MATPMTLNGATQNPGQPAPPRPVSPPVQMTKLDDRRTILERKKQSHDERHMQKVWNLRLIAGNVLDITSAGSYSQPRKTDGKYADIEPTDVEEARHNPVAVNVDVQSQSLSFTAPDISWRFVPNATGMVRRAWYLRRYEEQHHVETFKWALKDMIISGAGTIGGGVRDGMPFLEWWDELDVQWDQAFKELHKKRYVYYTKHLPMSEAVKLYPALSGMLGWKEGDTGGEKSVDVTCYYSHSTRAALYKDTFLEGPEPNDYGRIPAVMMRLEQNPSMRNATGTVEHQLGTLQIMLRTQRAWREIMLRAGSPVGKAKGLNPAQVQQIKSGEEAVILSMTKDGDFEWAQPAAPPEMMLEHYEKQEQFLAAQSGVDPTMLSQTDMQVDFATQLSLMAGRSGVRGKNVAMRFEEGVKAAIDLLLDIGAKFAPPETLYVQNAEVDFGQMGMMADGRNALQSQLGSDGIIQFKPGSMEYKPPAQGLQEIMVFGQVLAEAMALPPSLQPNFIDLAAKAFGVDNPDEWSKAVAAEIQQQQAQMAAQTQAMQQAAQNGADAKAMKDQQGAPPNAAAQNMRGNKTVSQALGKPNPMGRF